jgi:hypothetical protein
MWLAYEVKAKREMKAQLAKHVQERAPSSTDRREP